MRNLPISCWAAEDIPTNRAEKFGYDHLSNAELLSILIGSGSQDCDAVELSRMILDACGNNLNSLARMPKGFIWDCVVYAEWHDNTITWRVMQDIGRGDSIGAYHILEERLKALESDEQNVYSMIQHGELGKLELVQSFYFKEDE